MDKNLKSTPSVVQDLLFCVWETQFTWPPSHAQLPSSLFALVQGPVGKDSSEASSQSSQSGWKTDLKGELTTDLCGLRDQKEEAMRRLKGRPTQGRLPGGRNHRVRLKKGEGSGHAESSAKRVKEKWGLLLRN